MRRIPRSRSLLTLIALTLTVAALVSAVRTATARPPDDARIALVAAADDARIAAMVAADPKPLAEILSEDLHYAHSNGTVDTKQSFLDLVESGRAKYLAYRSIERAFTFPAEGIALGTGRAEVTVENAVGRSALSLSYLSVWRQERGRWRFLAWQSARLEKPSSK